MRIAEVHVAPDDRMPPIYTTIPDARDVLHAEVLRSQLEAQRSVRGLDRIADTGDQGNARLGAAVADLIGEGKHASGRSEE
jgi:hypothetical protein